MTSKALIELKDQALELYRESRFHEAIHVINQGLESSPGYVPLIILKAQAIQLIDEGYEQYGDLENVRELLQEAVNLDESSIDARVELAHFLYAVLDDTQNAYEQIQKASLMCNEFLKECDDLMNNCEQEMRLNKELKG